MSSPGLHRCTFSLPRACATLLVFGALTATALAQTPATPSMPAPAPANADTLQSLPAAMPAPTAATSPAAASPAATTPYRDPLEQPIVVSPAPAAVHIDQATQASITPASSAAAATVAALPAYDFEEEKPSIDQLGSTYIPVDSPIYPMALRLYSLGYLDTAFISMRPWTRRSLLHMLDKSRANVMDGGNDEAIAIFARLNTLMADETPVHGFSRGRVYGVDSVYTRFMSIYGQTLRDSYHLGETIMNDYGRPYNPGFNNITGFSSVNEWGHFSLNLRGEYQHSPSGNGYSLAMAQTLANLDFDNFVPSQNPMAATIPYGFLPAQNPFRLVEASLSFHVLGHEISGGKTDSWMGPAQGGAFAWSNNAENIYAFRINRVEPLYIPLLSRLLGPLRYDFQVGDLKSHIHPRDPWVHSEMFAFRPTANFEFGFQRTVIWGGEGHEAVTIHTFLRSFFSFDDTESDPNSKLNSNDPGARFTAFNFSWRLPFLRHSVTLYTDSEAHDDVTPPSAPRRAAYRPGVYLSHVPGIPKLDFRIEGVSTDTSTLRSIGGLFNYFEGQQRQGYTNKGQVFGDWIGREAKGGQAWLTYHLSASEWIQLSFMHKQTPKDFIPNAVNQTQFGIDITKQIFRDVQLHAWDQVEQWTGPFYLPGKTRNNVAAVQITWFPKLKTTPVSLNGK